LISSKVGVSAGDSWINRARRFAKSTSNRSLLSRVFSILPSYHKQCKGIRNMSLSDSCAVDLLGLKGSIDRINYSSSILFGEQFGGLGITKRMLRLLLISACLT